jgi:hypothetical protein
MRHPHARSFFKGSDFMSIVLSYPQFEATTEASPIASDVMRRQVWGILSGLYPPGKAAERRVDQRFPYPYLLYLTRVGGDGISPAGESVVVVGKHLSEHGLGFFYQKPLPDRRMIASLQMQESRWVGFLIDITWCRFTQHGWYDSGGRFLQAVPSPIGK